MNRRDKLMEEKVAEATEEQRSVHGNPNPGHNYWTRQALLAVEARYHAFGIDMSPYRAALS